MKWFEIIEDCGDGTFIVLRFKTKKEASVYSRTRTEYCSDIEEVNTDSSDFFYNSEYK